VTPADHAVAEALWRNVDDDFGADSAHRAFVEHCRQCDALAFAAQRYRERRQSMEDRPEELAAIDKQLAAVAAVAMAQLNHRPAGPPPGESVRRIVTIVGVVLFVGALGLLIAALQL
jgi:hypothetical protein